jgi:hypothetical protein
MKTFRAGATRDVVLIVIAVVLLAGAGLYFKMGGGTPDDAPDDQYLDFRCQACEHEFRMSYAEFEKYFNQRRMSRQEDGRTVDFACPKCGEHKAKRVAEP